MINRSLNSLIQKKLSLNKPIILLGAEQAGKSTLLKEIARSIDPDFLIWDCADPVIRKRLTNINGEDLNELVGNSSTVFINEVQKIPDFRINLKNITGFLKNIQLFIAGSGVPLSVSETEEEISFAGLEYILYPVSWAEFEEYSPLTETKKKLEARLIYGLFPEVVTNPGSEREILKKLTDKNLFKDSLIFASVRKPESLEKLLQALSLNIGNEISLNEVSDIVKIDKNTVSSYISLLEKAFIIKRLQPFNRNHALEINQSRKIFFLDNGIRNAVISNFNSLDLRQDAQALWENFCISERHKFLYYRQRIYNCYFWRTTSKKHVDYIEEYEGVLHAYEFKWNSHAKKFFSKTFINAYPEATSDIISPSNFSKFLTSSKVKSY
jgi:predicted AAA+ superfamily ATPase